MRVIGPGGWDSTQRLSEALVGVESDLVFRFGASPRLNGLEQLVRFREAGIPCPIFTPDANVAMEWFNSGKIVWGRQLNHTHGRDIVPPRMSRRWRESDYWVQMVPSTHEYRQHIFDSRAIRLGEKVLTEEPWRRLQVRSRSNGWTISYPPQSPTPEGIRDLAKRAVKACGYLFGAVDVLFDSMKNQLYVLEVNSSPSLRDDATLAVYVREVKRWVRRNQA